MRVAKVLETLLGITGIVVESAEVSAEGVVFGVRPRRKKPRCGGCGKRAPGYDQREARQWRHLNLGATRIWLGYAPRRVECARCGVVNRFPGVRPRAGSARHSRRPRRTWRAWPTRPR